MLLLRCHSLLPFFVVILSCFSDSSDPVKYHKLRENAKYSVISCEQVAQAWLIEYCRLRRKLPVNYGRLEDLSKKYAQLWEPLAWARAHDSSATASSPFTSPIQISRKASITEPPAALPRIDGPVRTEGPIRAAEGRAKPSETPGLVPVKIRYTPKLGIRPRAVAVSGSFDDWQVRRPMSWDNALQAFSINMAVRPGRYVYKLIVDGDWTLNPDAQADKDASGNLNNVLKVD